MNQEGRIVILGAGYAGVLIAKKLARRIGKGSGTITLIDRHPYHTMLTELHEVAAGRVPEDAIRIPLDKIFEGRPVNVIQDEIVDVDFESRTLKSTDATYAYDYLVIATGSRPTFFGVHGAEQHAFKLWSMTDAVRLRSHVKTCFRQAMEEKDPIKRAELLTFVTVGAGFTGVEMAGELAEWIPELCRTFHMERSEVRLIVADLLPRVLPIFPEKLSNKVMRHFRRHGVEVHLSTTIESVAQDHVMIGGARLSTRTVIWSAGVESSELATGLTLEKKGRGRLVTDAYLRSVEQERVYVAGDNIHFVPEGETQPVPQMVENAEHSAHTISTNIINQIQGKPLEPYVPHFHGAMVCIGGRYGVAHLGLPGRFFCLSGFFALLIKHFINVVYFFQVAGFNKVWIYMLHEGFHIRNRRSLVGGHFSKASPNFWLVPLRLFVGYKWLYTGWTKLELILDDPGKIFLIPVSPELAVSSATVSETAADSAEVWGQALPVPEFIQSLSQSMMDLLFYTQDGAFTHFAGIFQTLMVSAEVLIGLLLLGGLFTAPAAIAAILLGLMIYVSGMAPSEMLWYWCASVALIGGSGSTFGLDYYVYPVLKRLWKRIPFVRKHYLYTE